MTATASEIVAALRNHFTVRQSSWAMLTEVTIDDPEAIERYESLHDLAYGPGRDWSAGLPWESWSAEDQAFFGRRGPLYRRIDALLINTAPSHKPIPHERLAVEVKVTRADFFRDTPAKRKPWMDVTHRFAYAVPTGLVTPEEVPAGCALLEYDPHPSPSWKPQIAWRRNVKRTEAAELPMQFWAYLAARASRAEARLANIDATQIKAAS